MNLNDTKLLQVIDGLIKEREALQYLKDAVTLMAGKGEFATERVYSWIPASSLASCHSASAAVAVQVTASDRVGSSLASLWIVRIRVCDFLNMTAPALSLPDTCVVQIP